MDRAQSRNERLQAGPSCVDHGPSEKENRRNPKIVHFRPSLASQVLNTSAKAARSALSRQRDEN